MTSLLQNKKECYVCGITYNLHQHHIYFGKNRKNSDKYNCWCWLCSYHHNGSNQGVHYNKQLDIRLKEECQRAFEKENSRQEFMRIFGRNYL